MIIPGKRMVLSVSTIHTIITTIYTSAGVDRSGNVRTHRTIKKVHGTIGSKNPNPPNTCTYATTGSLRKRLGTTSMCITVGPWQLGEGGGGASHTTELAVSFWASSANCAWTEFWLGGTGVTFPEILLGVELWSWEEPPCGDVKFFFRPQARHLVFGVKHTVLQFTHSQGWPWPWPEPGGGCDCDHCPPPCEACPP